MKQFTSHSVSSRLTTIFIFSLASFHASGIRAQTPVNVNLTHQTKTQDEPSIAVRPWDASGNPDGRTIAVSWQQSGTPPDMEGAPNWDDEATLTSRNTNGAGWTTPGAIPMPGITFSGLGDAKLAYREVGTDAIKVPQLLAAFTAWEDDGWPGVYVNFSSNNGDAWGTAVAIKPASDYTVLASTLFPIRPQIVTNNPSSAINGNTYIAWTDYDNSVHTGVTVHYARLDAGNTTVSNSTTLATSTSTTGVFACDISVDQNDNVYVLWMRTHELSDATPNKRDFYVSVATHGAGTWTTYTVLTGSTKPTLEPPYVAVDIDLDITYLPDLPCMAVSKSSCGDEKLFVSFTEKPSAPTTNGPSDLFLTSTTLPLGSTPVWSTKTNIGNDNVLPLASNPYWFQFEPTMAPDGRGEVFVLYYTCQAFGSPQVANGSPQAILYESGVNRGPDIRLSTSTDASMHDVSDFIGIAWDPVSHLVHPVWTDFISSSKQGTFTASVSPGILQGASSNPTIGLLGYSSQRKIVMTGNTAHLVGLVQNPYNNFQNAHIYYMEQTSNADGSAKNWTTPIQLDEQLNPHDPIYAVGHPAIGVYQYSDASTSQKAVAVVWKSVDDVSGMLSHYNIRVKEWTDFESGTTCDWSTLEINGLDKYAEVWNYGGWFPDADITVAPLTKPVSVTGGTPSKERCLIGWVITFFDQKTSGGLGSIVSHVYLRGNTSGSRLQNDNWGVYTGSAWAAHKNELVVDPSNDLYGFKAVRPFLSCVSNESNWNGKKLDPSKKGDNSIEVAFTGWGGKSYGGAWVYNASYSTVVGGPVPLGEYAGATSTPVLSPLSPPPPPYSIVGSLSLDRNPSITITSTGQKLVAWEHLDALTVPLIGVTRGGCAMPVLSNSSIRVVKTLNQTPEWSSKNVKDVWSATAAGPSWDWLLNPSITSFPKTQFLNSSSTAADKDPGAAELLFWEKDRMWYNNTNTVVNGHPPCSLGPETPPYQLHEHRFVEQPAKEWTGDWIEKDNADPLGWGPFSSATGNGAANSQRSFGIYNYGPQYDLLHPGKMMSYTGVPYLKGLSYGIGNAVSGTTIQNTLLTADVGAQKGTYDTTLGVQLYRSETRVKDSGSVTFKWGKVYVEDTTLALPIREIMMHNGIPTDSIGFVSHDAMRDSIFATEWFDWPVSAQINYDRLLLIPQRGYFTSMIDSNVFDSVLSYDSTLDSTIYNSWTQYDTIPEFHSDSSIHDSSFYGPGIRMQYTIEMVHANGQIDTIEQPVFDPYNNKWITPRTVHVVHGGSFADTVMLRVRGRFTGIPDDDSLVEMFNETMLDTYPSYDDSTIAVGTGGGFISPGSSCFSVVGPYPNPSSSSAANVSVLVHYCSTGATITAQVFDVLGSPLGSTVTFTSDGQTWDRLAIPAPSLAGTYFIHVSVAGYSATLSYSTY